MASLDNSPARGFFHDFHGFKDFVTIVIVCAPNQFLREDWRAPDDQMNLDRAFAGLHYGLDLTANEKGESPLLAQCRELIDTAYAEYVAGRVREGRIKLQGMEKLLKKLPSR